MTMDPLEKTLDCSDLIFQHFSVDEVLELSMVSKSWYKEIGRSSAAMKKVWLNVGDRFNEPKKVDLRAFRASERNYQNFKMSEIENGLQILLFPRRNWRRALIDIQSFTSFKDYTNLLKVFNETITELDIFDMDIGFEGGDVEALNFPQLKKLRIDFVTSVALKPFLKFHPKLVKLNLENIIDLSGARDKNGQQLVTQLLKLQNRLTHLKLHSDAFDKIFTHRESFDFKLTNLLLEYSGNYENEESQRLLNNLEAFLTDQKQIRWITLCEWTCGKIIARIFDHESIERISFDYFDSESKRFETSKLVVNRNNKIRQIDFDCETITLCSVKPFLNAAPNVEILHFFHVSQEILKHCVLNLKHLKTLKYCSIFEDFSDYYSSLKKENVQAINCELEIVENKFSDVKPGMGHVIHMC